MADHQGQVLECSAHHRSDEPCERRIRRARAVVQEVRCEPRADDRPGGKAGERERGRDQPSPKPSRRRHGSDAERDPVDAGHGSKLEIARDEPRPERLGEHPVATLPREPGA